MDAHNQTPELDMDAPVGCLERLVQSLWIIPAVILGIAFFLLALFGPLYLLAWGLVTFIDCDPGFALLLSLAVGVPWGMLLPHLLD